MDDIDQISISTLAKSAGVSTRTIRFYEEKGLLKPCPRRNGKRYFTQDQADRLNVILIARNMGFSLDHIREHLKPDVPEIAVPCRSFAQHVTETNRLIEELSSRLSALTGLPQSRTGERLITTDSNRA